MKHNIIQFVTTNYPLLLKKWEEILIKGINATSNKYAAEGQHGSGAYFSIISDLIDKNIKNLTSDLLETIVYSFSSNKIKDFDSKELKEVLYNQTDSTLERYDAILDERMKPYNSNPGIKDVSEKLKKELREKARTHLFSLLNKFENDLYSIKRMNKAEDRASRAQFIAYISIIIAVASFIAPFHWWKDKVSVIPKYMRELVRMDSNWR